MYLSTALTSAGFSLVTVALPFRFESLGLSVVQYGSALAVYAFGTLATESLWGAVAFRLGRGSLIVGLGGAVAVVVLAVGLSPTFILLAVTLGLFGMLSVYAIPLGRWLAVTARGPGTSGSGAGRWGLFFGLGLVAGTSTGPVVFVEFGFLVLAISAAVVFLAGSVALAAVRWSSLELPPRERGALGEVRDLMHRHFLLCCTLVVVYFLSYPLTVNFLQYYSVAVFGGTTSEAGYVLGAARGVAVVSGLLLGPAVDRWGPHRTAPVGFLLLASGALGSFVSGDYPEMVAATLVFSVGFGCLSASLLPFALTTVPRASQGTAVGVFGSFEDLGLMVGPVLIGTVYATYGARSIFPVVAGAAIAGSVLAALVPRLAGRPSRSMPPIGPEPD